MGASAVDIITYVGVPLAVLGVLPTIYTCLKSILTLRSIRHTLNHSYVPAITRSSLLSGIIEVEIPRKSIHPLNRDEDGYFHLSMEPSSLKGGTWTLMNWKELSIGTKNYRLQYHDELFQPQAEVDFEALVAFLLDRGAVPSQAGFADLRNSGLWTPTGTKLLLSPSRRDAVLWVSTSEDSDGILSLAMSWRKEWDLRGIKDLPPYWTRIHKPHEKPAAIIPEVEESTHDCKEKDVVETSQAIELKTVPSHSSSLQKYVPHAGSIRVRVGMLGVDNAHYEDDPSRRLMIRHLKAQHNEPNPVATWFCSAATALRSSSGGLWAYAIPEQVLSFARREVIPCGVMCLLELLPEDAVPQWRTPSLYDNKIEEFERNHQRMEKLRKMNEESRLPPAQQKIAREARMRQELSDMSHDAQRRRLEEERRREMEIKEALSSQRLGSNVVAEANRKWLEENSHIPANASIAATAEQILWQMIESDEVARAVVDMLELWHQWTEGGGMTRGHMDTIVADRVSFAYACCILGVIRDMAASSAGNLVSDMQECLRVWKKVRLG